MTVFVYVNTSKQVGDAEHIKVFTNQDAGEKWFEENDPEGVAAKPCGARDRWFDRITSMEMPTSGGSDSMPPGRDLFLSKRSSLAAIGSRR
jgi:hypothetical protein